MRVNEQLTRRAMQPAEWGMKEKMRQQTAEIIAKWRDVWVAREDGLMSGCRTYICQCNYSYGTGRERTVRRPDKVMFKIWPVSLNSFWMNLNAPEEGASTHQPGTVAAGRYMSRAESPSPHLAAAMKRDKVHSTEQASSAVLCSSWLCSLTEMIARL